MALDKYGWRTGNPNLTPMKVKSGTAVYEGDLLVMSSGYVTPAGAGGTVIGVAWDSCDAPTNDGDKTIRVDKSAEGAVYCYPGGSAASQANVGKTCDVGGARVIDETASADDNIVIVGIDGSDYLVTIRPTYTGVA